MDNNQYIDDGYGFYTADEDDIDISYIPIHKLFPDIDDVWGDASANIPGFNVNDPKMSRQDLNMNINSLDDPTKRDDVGAIANVSEIQIETQVVEALNEVLVDPYAESQPVNETKPVEDAVDLGELGGDIVLPIIENSNTPSANVPDAPFVQNISNAEGLVEQERYDAAHNIPGKTLSVGGENLGEFIDSDKNKRDYSSTVRSFFKIKWPESAYTISNVEGIPLLYGIEKKGHFGTILATTAENRYVVYASPGDMITHNTPEEGELRIYDSATKTHFRLEKSTRTKGDKGVDYYPFNMKFIKDELKKGVKLRVFTKGNLICMALGEKMHLFWPSSKDSNGGIAKRIPVEDSCFIKLFFKPDNLTPIEDIVEGLRVAIKPGLTVFQPIINVDVGSKEDAFEVIAFIYPERRITESGRKWTPYASVCALDTKSLMYMDDTDWGRQIEEKWYDDKDAMPEIVAYTTFVYPSNEAEPIFPNSQRMTGDVFTVFETKDGEKCVATYGRGDGVRLPIVKKLDKFGWVGEGIDINEDGPREYNKSRFEKWYITDSNGAAACFLVQECTEKLPRMKKGDIYIYDHSKGENPSLQHNSFTPHCGSRDEDVDMNPCFVYSLDGKMLFRMYDKNELLKFLKNDKLRDEFVYALKNPNNSIFGNQVYSEDTAITFFTSFGLYATSARNYYKLIDNTNREENYHRRLLGDEKYFNSAAPIIGKRFTFKDGNVLKFYNETTPYHTKMYGDSYNAWAGRNGPFVPATKDKDGNERWLFCHLGGYIGYHCIAISKVGKVNFESSPNDLRMSIWFDNIWAMHVDENGNGHMLVSKGQLGYGSSGEMHRNYALDAEASLQPVSQDNPLNLHVLPIKDGAVDVDHRGGEYLEIYNVLERENGEIIGLKVCDKAGNVHLINTEGRVIHASPGIVRKLDETNDVMIDSIADGDIGAFEFDDKNFIGLYDRGNNTLVIKDLKTGKEVFTLKNPAGLTVTKSGIFYKTSTSAKGWNFVNPRKIDGKIKMVEFFGLEMDAVGDAQVNGTSLFRVKDDAGKYTFYDAATGRVVAKGADRNYMKQVKGAVERRFVSALAADEEFKKLISEKRTEIRKLIDIAAGDSTILKKGDDMLDFIFKKIFVGEENTFRGLFDHNMSPHAPTVDVKRSIEFLSTGKVSVTEGGHTVVLEFADWLDQRFNDITALTNSVDNVIDGPGGDYCNRTPQEGVSDERVVSIEGEPNNGLKC